MSSTQAILEALTNLATDLSPRRIAAILAYTALTTIIIIVLETHTQYTAISRISSETNLLDKLANTKKIVDDSNDDSLRTAHQNLSHRLSALTSTPGIYFTPSLEPPPNYFYRLIIGMWPWIIFLVATGLLSQKNGDEWPWVAILLVGLVSSAISSAIPATGYWVIEYVLIPPISTLLSIVIIVKTMNKLHGKQDPDQSSSNETTDHT